MSALVVHPEFKRDQWKRPKITPTDGGRPVPYKRCTSYVDVLDNRYNLELWKQRMTALGIAERDDLRLAVLAHKDDKNRLNTLVDQATEAAKASSAATKGTALHALTDLVDRGQDLPETLPDDVVASLRAYKEATADLKVIHIEHPTVLDTLRIAGTPDRIVEYKGERYIADTKTGSIEFGVRKIAMQLAVYSRSYLYDVETAERTPHGCSTSRGIIYHMPAGAGTAELVWVDLEAGWESVLVARDVWGARLCADCAGRNVSSCKHQFDLLTEPFGPPPRPSLRREKADQAKVTQQVENEQQKLDRMIRACDTADMVRDLWANNAVAWTDTLTAVAKTHIKSLGREAS
ncbi:PD-(D/E)XK nuclease family protein [Nocardioides stalactiti]|uniref:PD-(D/E)XK nuclease family protein n=1 Tax=Nocardioides stalactiti TaxID=2755356 RepID=UPI0016022AC2|nr:PD-(D/E)XK nuclease family protein [Nocardioides stalactiti]